MCVCVLLGFWCCVSGDEIVVSTVCLCVCVCCLDWCCVSGDEIVVSTVWVWVCVLLGLVLCQW